MGAAGGLVASLASGNKSKSLNSSPASEEGEGAGGWSEIIVESAVQNDVQLEGHNFVKGNNNDGPFTNGL